MKNKYIKPILITLLATSMILPSTSLMAAETDTTASYELVDTTTLDKGETGMDDLDDEGLISQGSAGENLTYQLIGLGGGSYSLTLTGSGEPSSSLQTHPWRAYKDQITSVVMSGTMSRIIASEFQGYSRLASVTIPSSVTIIGPGAFQGCSSLTSMKLPDKVTSIGTNAFAETGLTSI